MKTERDKYICPDCGHEEDCRYLPDYCPDCGQRLELDEGIVGGYRTFWVFVPAGTKEKTIKCPRCEKNILANDNFCGYCGCQIK